MVRQHHHERNNCRYPHEDGYQQQYGTLRGGGEEDWKFTNFTMTKVKNPFSIDCYYDKNYNSDPAVDKANARALIVLPQPTTAFCFRT